jgi:hypothetical protein
VKLFRFHPGRKIACLAFTADGTGLLTAQPGIGVILRDASDGRPVRAFSGTDAGPHYRLIPCPSGRWLAVFQSGLVTVFDLDGQRRWALKTRYAYCLNGAWDREDLLVGGGREGLLRVRVGGWWLRVERWGRGAGLDRAVVKGFSPCGRWAVACRREKPPALVELPAGALRAEFQLPMRRLDGRMAWMNMGPYRRDSWDRPPAFADPGLGLVMYGHPPGEAIVAPGADAVAVWDCESVTLFDCGIAVASPPGAPPTVLPVLRQLDVLATGTRYQFPPTLSGVIWCHDKVGRLPRLAFVPDHRTVLTVSTTQRVQRWDLIRGALVNEWNWPVRTPHCVAVDADGCRAAAGDAGGRVVVWDLD